MLSVIVERMLILSKLIDIEKECNDFQARLSLHGDAFVKLRKSILSSIETFCSDVDDDFEVKFYMFSEFITTFSKIMTNMSSIDVVNIYFEQLVKDLKSEFDENLN